MQASEVCGVLHNAVLRFGGESGVLNSACALSVSYCAPYVMCSWNRAVVMGTGEPLAPRSAWQQMTEAFLQEFPGAYFYHITEDFAGVLHDMGYYINGCGTETTLQVCAAAAVRQSVRGTGAAARHSHGHALAGSS